MSLDPIFYADKYPDLKKAFGYNRNLLLNHWNTYGKVEGRICCSPKKDLNEFLDNSTNVSLFAMHSTQNIIPEHEVAYINFLLEISNKVIVLTTNKSHENDQRLFSDNVLIMPCENKGRDFGLFHQFFLKNKLDKVEQLYLINDSCYCIKSLKDIVTKNFNQSYWGITDSNEYSHHVQSYFIGINSQSLIQKVIGFFIQNNFSKITNKNDIIQKGEIGLSKFVTSLGISIHAEYSRNDTFRDSKYSNSAHAEWKKLRQLGCPIIKKTRRN